MSDYIEIDYYFMGIYQGKRKIGKNSICGKILSGDLLGGISQVQEMVNDINDIPNVQAGIKIAEAEQVVSETDERHVSR